MLYSDVATLAIIAGTEYFIRSFPMGWVPRIAGLLSTDGCMVCDVFVVLSKSRLSNIVQSYLKLIMHKVLK